MENGLSTVTLLTVLGALTKVLATIVTHPLIFAKTTLQSAPIEGTKRFRNFVRVLL